MYSMTVTLHYISKYISFLRKVVAIIMELLNYKLISSSQQLIKRTDEEMLNEPRNKIKIKHFSFYVNITSSHLHTFYVRRQISEEQVHVAGGFVECVALTLAIN